MDRRSEKRMKSKNSGTFSRFTALTCAAVISSGLALGGCGQQEVVEEADNSILVETAFPQTENIELDGDFIGTVEADNEITVVVKTGGDVTATYFEEGDRVEAGDLLFTVDDASAQITMASAQAGLESANASIASAEANVNLQQLYLIYTQEQIEQSLGEIDTDQMQLENAVASAKYALQSANYNVDLYAEQFGLAAEEFEDLEDEIDDYADDADSMDDYADELSSIKDKYDDIKNASSVSSAISISGLGLSSDDYDSASDVAQEYIYRMTGGAAASEYDLGVMINAAESSASSYRSARSTLKDNKDTYKLNMMSAAISKETAKYSVYTAEDSLALAQKMLDDYEMYTKAVVLAGATYQLAGADVSAISAETSLTQAQANAKQAQASVDSAQLALDYTRVTSPVSGIVTQKSITLNNTATQGETAYVITPDDNINVTFYVSESVMEQLGIGEEIAVERNGAEYTAQITENAGVADSSSGLFKIKAQLVSGSDSLVTGTSVKLTMATQKAENVMTIPVDSVYYESETAYVYVKDGNTAVKTYVETGIANDEYIEIKSGLTTDDEIITNWASQLRNGAEVKTQEEKDADAAQPDTETEEDADGADTGDAEADDAEESAADGGVTISEVSENAEEAASIADLTDTERLNYDMENRITKTAAGR